MQNLHKRKIEQKFLNIQEAAKYLGVSAKTLRRWDVSNQLPTVRTIGGHRRYRLSDLKNFKRNGYQKTTESNTHNINNSNPRSFNLEPQQKIALTIMSLILAVTFCSFAFARAASWNKGTKEVLANYIKGYANTLSQDYFKYHSSDANLLLSGITGSYNFPERNNPEDFVLAASTTTDAPTFNVNVISNFYDVAHFLKGLTGASVDAGTLNATGSATFATTITNGNATY